MKNIILTLLILLFTATLEAQIGIGTTTPEGALDITSTGSGVVVPRIGLFDKNDLITVTNPQGGSPIAGTLIWNTATAGVAPNNVTPGFYYWSGSTWIPITGNIGREWTLDGNAITNPATEFIGTTSNQDFRIRTNGSERFNFTSNGRLRAYDNGVSTQPTYSWMGDDNTGIWRPGADQLGFATNGAERLRIPNANQIHAMNLGTAALPFYSFSADSNTGIYSSGTDELAISTNAALRMRFFNNGQIVVNSLAAPFASDQFSVYSTGSAINGYAGGANSIGAYAQSTGAGGIGIYGITNGTNSVGVLGTSVINSGYGVEASNTTTTGTGLMAIGNNSIGYIITGGSGAALNGNPLGAVSYGNNAASGWGIAAAGNDLGTSIITGGGGGSFTGTQWGVFGSTTGTGNVTSRAAFVGNYNENTTLRTVYVGYTTGGINYKILGTGSASVSTTMPTRDGERILFAPEAPENWFFDIGEVTLADGKATVALDPIFVDCISDSKPFKVFVQGGENTLGSIKITRNQNAKTFIVEDLGGASNGTVQYSIYGIWKQKENLRFPKYVQPFETNEIEKIPQRAAKRRTIVSSRN